MIKAYIQSWIDAAWYSYKLWNEQPRWKIATKLVVIGMIIGALFYYVVAMENLYGSRTRID